MKFAIGVTLFAAAMLVAWAFAAKPAQAGYWNECYYDQVAHMNRCRQCFSTADGGKVCSG